MASTLQVLQANEVSRILTFQQISAPSFSGATVYLVVKNPAGVISNYTCTVVSNVPRYTTLGTEFPTEGNYILQLEYKNGSVTYWSNELQIKVVANLKSN